MGIATINITKDMMVSAIGDKYNNLSEEEKFVFDNMLNNLK